MPAWSGVGSLSRRIAQLFALLLGAIAVSVMTAGAAGAQTDTTNAEDYPPDAIVNLIDPFGCEPPGISGEIGAVQAGSTVTLQLLINGTVVNTVTATADASGQATYSIPVPPNQYGPAIVRASGTNSIGQGFTLDTSGTISKCPGPLPRTGNSDLRLWLTLGGAAVLAGGVLVAVASRRRWGASRA
jgi:LPXTG-motif cell wall-anchored protein